MSWENIVQGHLTGGQWATSCGHRKLQPQTLKLENKNGCMAGTYACPMGGENKQNNRPTVRYETEQQAQEMGKRKIMKRTKHLFSGDRLNWQSLGKPGNHREDTSSAPGPGGQQGSAGPGPCIAPTTCHLHQLARDSVEPNASITAVGIKGERSQFHTICSGKQEKGTGLNSFHEASLC